MTRRVVIALAFPCTFLGATAIPGAVRSFCAFAFIKAVPFCGAFASIKAVPFCSAFAFIKAVPFCGALAFPVAASFFGAVAVPNAVHSFGAFVLPMAQAEDALPIRATDAVLADLAPALAAEDAGHLGMKFEVTFMQIDVANMEARIPAEMAARVEAVVRQGKRTEAREEEIVALLLEPDTPILLTMTYLRDAEYERFAKGLRTSMEQAAASGAIAEDEQETLTAQLLETSAPLAESGVAKDAVLVHLIEGESVRIVYLAPDGSVQLDRTESNAMLGRALRAAWFGSASRFRKKLVASLYE